MNEEKLDVKALIQKQLSARLLPFGYHLKESGSIQKGELEFQFDFSDSKDENPPPSDRNIVLNVFFIPIIVSSMVEDKEAFFRMLDRTGAGRAIEGITVLSSYHISPETSEALLRKGINFVDLNGNCFLFAKGKIAISHTGNKNQFVLYRPVRYEKGRTKTVLTALLENAKQGKAEWTCRGLETAINISRSTIFIVLKRLEKEGAVVKLYKPRRFLVRDVVKLKEIVAKAETDK